jgi:hypothetical protein
MDRKQFNEEVFRELGVQPQIITNFLWARLEKEYNEGYEDGRSEKANRAETRVRQKITEMIESLNKKLDYYNKRVPSTEYQSGKFEGQRKQKIKNKYDELDSLFNGGTMCDFAEKFYELKIFIDEKLVASESGGGASYKENAGRAINILISDAEKQLNKALENSDYTSASTTTSYKNGLEVAKNIIENC